MVLSVLLKLSNFMIKLAKSISPVFFCAMVNKMTNNNPEEKLLISSSEIAEKTKQTKLFTTHENE